MPHTQITYKPNLTVGGSPDITNEWCGYNPNTYKFDAFLKGIFKDICLGVISNTKKRIPPGHAFLLDALDPEAILGDAFRHIEFGRSFIRDYQEVKKPGESLGAVSADPINIIVETDKTIEKWECANSHNLNDFATFFYDFSGYLYFVKFLEGKLEYAIDDALSIIIKAIICSNPAEVILGDKDFSRIFGTVINYVDSTEVTQESSNERAVEYNKLMREKVNKYYGKAVELWKNIQFYNPYHYSHSNEFEESRKDFIYEGAKPGQNKSKKLAQELYTNAHTEEPSEGENTGHLKNLHRNDCLFALFDFISKTINIMTTERTSEFCLGTDTTKTIYDVEEAKKRILATKGLGLDGRPIAGHGEDGVITDTQTTSKNDQDFEAISERQFLGIYLNPEDYMDLKTGISRFGQMDSRNAKLADLGEDLNIFSERAIPPGFVRILDKRAVVLKPFYTMSDVAQPVEKLHVRYKLFYQFAIAIFKNFCGCLGVPTPHFVASPRFYDKYGLIGQKIEKKKD